MEKYVPKRMRPRGCPRGRGINKGASGAGSYGGEKVIVVGEERKLRLPSQLGVNRALSCGPRSGRCFPVVPGRAGGRGPFGAFVHLALQHNGAAG